jgi:glyoxylase I family protein
MSAPSARGTVQGFHHIAVRVKDFDAVVRFYKEGLGLAERIAWGEGDKRAIMLDAGNGNCVEVFAGGAEKPEGQIVHLALRTDDVDALLRRAVAAGAVVTVPAKNVDIPTKTGPVPVRIAFVKTPGGEVVEFFQSSAV